MTVKITLTKGQIAAIDDQDSDLAELNWFAHKSHSGFYAVRKARNADGKRRALFLHQIIAERMGIMGQPDHRDRNGLNNTRANLRAATNSQNMANRNIQKNNTSGFKGVSWHKRIGKWQSTIRIDGKLRSLGYFDDLQLEG